MKRALLCALLLLTACQKKDPGGTIQPDAKGLTDLKKVQPGDSPPFRLQGGDMESFILPADGDTDRDLMRDCDPSIQLVKYGEAEGRDLPLSPSGIGGGRINALEPDVYSLRLTASQLYCSYSVSFVPIKN